MPTRSFLERIKQRKANKRQRARDLSRSGFTPEVHIRWGPTGSGKTRFVYDTHDCMDIYTPSILDTNNGCIWFNGYDGHKVILFHFDRIIEYHILLALIKKCPARLPIKRAFLEEEEEEIKDGFTRRLARKIYIESYSHPKDWYPGEDFGELERRITSITHCVLTPSGP